MKKTHNVRIKSVLLYTILIFVSNYIAYWVSVMIAGIFQPLVGKAPMVMIVIFIVLIYILIGFTVPLIAVFYLFKSVVSEQYIQSEDKYCWLKSCLRLILPAEIIRFLACQITLGQINTTGAFAFLPSLVFESTYLRWTDRSEEVRQKLLQYNFTDFAVYALCFFAYIAIHLAFVMMIYKRFWLNAKNDRDDLIVYG